MTIPQQLDEIVFIRLSLIVFLVLYHSFCLYTGAWEQLQDLPKIPAYMWISYTSYSFMLESFVMISGYLFAFQLSKREIRWRYLINNKLKRLVVPSAVFSIAYILAFYPKPYSFSVLYDIINGVGHMWFLPMLFWCFVFTHCLYKYRSSEKIFLFGLFFLTFVPNLPLFLRISNSLHYMFFFYLGGYLW